MHYQEYLLELLAPSFCINCEQLGSPLCRNCYHSLEFYFQEPNEPTTNTRHHVEIVCRLHGPLSKLLKTYKYQHAKNLGPFLARLIFQHATLRKHYDYLSYIPLHPLKLHQRGFNQCQEITAELGKLWQLPVIAPLRRNRYLSPQAQVKDQKQRRKRVRGIFKIADNMQCEVENSRILLFDDVWTTGATWQEAYQILLTAGATTVDGLILASKK